MMLRFQKLMLLEISQWLWYGSSFPRSLSNIFLKFFEDISRFCGATGTTFLDSGDVCSGFQSSGLLLLACNGFFRIASGVTPADLYTYSMTATNLSIHVLVQVFPNILALI